MTFRYIIPLIYLLLDRPLTIFSQDYAIGSINLYGLNKKTKEPLLDTFTVTFNTGEIFKLKPDSDGFVLIRPINIGKYDITLSVRNYQSVMYKRIIVGEGKACHLTYSLTALSDSKKKKLKHVDH